MYFLREKEALFKRIREINKNTPSNNKYYFPAITNKNSTNQKSKQTN